jgi:hypothetical protein
MTPDSYTYDGNIAPYTTYPENNERQDAKTERDKTAILTYSILDTAIPGRLSASAPVKKTGIC